MKKNTILFLAICLMLVFLSGCTKPPTQDEMTKLKEAKKAAEAAVKELHKKRVEKARLEAEKGIE